MLWSGFAGLIASPPYFELLYGPSGQESQLARWKRIELQHGSSLWGRDYENVAGTLAPRWWGWFALFVARIISCRSLLGEGIGLCRKRIVTSFSSSRKRPTRFLLRYSIPQQLSIWLRTLRVRAQGNKKRIVRLDRETRERG